MENIVLISGSSHETLASEISEYLNIPLIPCRKQLFANSNAFVGPCVPTICGSVSMIKKER